MTRKEILKIKMPRKLDRRVKLTEEQKKLLVWRRVNEVPTPTYKRLGEDFGVSKTLAIIVCRPDIKKRRAEEYKERRKDGRYKPSREKRNSTQVEHRKYKFESLKEGRYTPRDNVSWAKEMRKYQKIKSK